MKYQQVPMSLLERTRDAVRVHAEHVSRTDPDAARQLQADATYLHAICVQLRNTRKRAVFVAIPDGTKNWAAMLL